MRQRLTRNPALYEKLAANVKREIPDDYRYNSKKLKHLKNVLHNISVALGTLTSALNEFSRLKGPEISPDGMLGGVGYIIPIKDIKQSLITAVHSLSNISDCIADELTNPKWNAENDKELKKIIKEKEDVEEVVEEKIEDVSDDISPQDIITKEASDNKSEYALAKAVTGSLKTFFKRG